MYWDLRFHRKNHVPIFGSTENFFFLKSYKFFRTSRSMQNLLADRMEALSVSENHSKSDSLTCFLFFVLNLHQAVRTSDILCTKQQGSHLDAILRILRSISIFRIYWKYRISGGGRGAAGVNCFVRKTLMLFGFFTKNELEPVPRKYEPSWTRILHF